MTLDEFIKDLTNLCQIVVPDLLAEIEVQRFNNQGQFNDNPKWEDNAKDVIWDKGRNDPLYDSGELYTQLTTPSNWKINTTVTKNNIVVEIPDEENFTDSKYDILDEGGNAPSYISPRGNKMKARKIPPRPFKKISAQDVQWVRDQLLIAIQKRYTQ